MTTLWARRAWAAAATFTALALAGSASIASASVQTLVGVDHVTFAWQPASGQPRGYFVWRSLNGGPLQLYSVAVAPQVEIPVEPGDQVAIQVAATGYDSAGASYFGPRSSLSDPVLVLPAPELAAAGSLLLRCASCPAIARRPLADASVVAAESSGLPLPWVVLGHGALARGIDAIVWHNTQTGELALWDAQSLSPIPGAVGIGATKLRGIGGADLDRDGVEEFIAQNATSLAVIVWRLTSSGFRPVALIAGPPGSELVAARDFDLDGRVDLVWRNAENALDLTRFALVPVFGATPISIPTLAPTRVANLGPTEVASVGDYNGDRSPDLLLRFDDGRLWIVLLRRGALLASAALPGAEDDSQRFVVASANTDGVAGDEIALWNPWTGEISILEPLVPQEAARTVVLSAGRSWRTLAIVGP